MSSTSFNRIGGVMVSVLTSSVVDLYSSPNRVKPKTIHLVCVAFPLWTQHEGELVKTDLLGIKIMCPSG
jgi:hypothetical protein